MSERAARRAIEEWVVVAASLLAASAHLFMAATTFLLPDEALHFVHAYQDSWTAVYETSLRSAHPPLFFLVLHGLLFFGRSALVLRAPSLLATGLLPWMTYSWLRARGRPAEALAAGLLTAFAPFLFPLGSAVRGYAWLLALMVAALWAFEAALARSSVARMALAAVLALLVGLTHYSGWIFLAAFGLDGTLRLARGAAPRRLVAAWLSGQASLLATGVWLYATHLSKLRGGPLEHAAVEGWLRASYFHGGSWIGFVASRTRELFAFFLGDPWVGAVGLILFIVGLWSAPPLERLFLVLPFALLAGAASGGWMPYGGTRHDAVLWPFCAMGLALGLGPLARVRTRGAAALPAVASALMAGWGQLVAEPAFGEMRAGAQQLAQVREAMETLGRTAPSATLFTDYQTAAELAFYLGDAPLAVPSSSTPWAQARWGGHRVVFTTDWVLDPTEYLKQSLAVTRQAGVSDSEPLWGVEIGWPPYFGRALAAAVGGQVQGRELGAFVSVLRLR